MNRSKLLALFLIVIFSLLAVIGFFHKGFMVTDDGGWMVIRLAAFYDALKDGQFPVRWMDTLNFGFGYPAANFLYPGFLYLGTPLVILTSNFVLSIKILFVLSILVGPLGMYLWLSQKYNSFSSLIGALVYVYAPYHLFNSVIRGSLGEILFLGVVPFLFWAIQTKRQLLISALFGLLLISHNTLALLFLPVILVYVLVIRKTIYKRSIDIVLPLILGTGMSLFFWIPALADLFSTRFFEISVSDYAKYFASIDLIGLIPLGILASALILFFKAKKRTYISVEGLFLLTGTISIFLASSFSDVVWRVLPVSFVQFPFRFLSLSVLSVAFLTSYILSNIKNHKIVGSLILIALVALSRNYFFPKEYLDYPDSFYSTNQSTTTIKNEYMPKSVAYDPVADTNSHIVKNGKDNFSKKASNLQSFMLDIEKESGSLTVGQVYFPGWDVYIDDKKGEIKVLKDSGIMQVEVPVGIHKVELRFRETPLRLFADIISLGSILCALWFFVIKKYAKV